MSAYQQRLIPQRKEKGPACLSAAQKRLWILSRLQPDDPSLNRPLAIRLRGFLDPHRLACSVTEVVRRHHILRSVFNDVGGEPLQIVLPLEPVVIKAVDLRAIPAVDREATARRIAVQESRRSIDLTRSPLLRPVLIRLEEDQHVLLLLMHHIVFDGWSEPILIRELSQHYDAFTSGAKASPLLDLPIQYGDFAVWQQTRLEKGDMRASLDYWKRQLAGIEPLSLPVDFRGPQANLSQGSKFRFTLGRSLTKQLSDLSRAENVTLFMTLLAAFQVLLSRYSGQKQFTIGVPVAGRPTLETEGLIGCFMNILVFRAGISQQQCFRQLLERTRAIALEAYTNQEAPLEKVIEEMRPERIPGRWPLFQVLFNFENLNGHTAWGGGLRMEPFAFDAGLIGGLDLSLEATVRTEELDFVLNFPPTRFSAETIQRMALHYHTLLANALADPARRISDLTFLSPAEHRMFVLEWNDTSIPDDSSRSIHELFEHRTMLAPDDPAVIFNGKQLSYRELNSRSNRLAHYLKKRGVGLEAVVGICLEKSLEMPVAILGVLKAGGAYVPIEPTYPQHRIEYMLENARTTVLLTMAKWADQYRARGISLQSDTLVLLDQDWEDIALEKVDNPDTPIHEDTLAYVIYTSGSTGSPKGVMITHRGVCNYLRWRREYFPLTPQDKVLQRSSYAFDDSVWEFFEPLMAGATLVLPEPVNQQDLGHLLELIDQHRITAACFVPSQLHALLEHPAIDKFRSVRRLTTGAESLSADLRDRVLTRLCKAFYNGYGPTETTIGATFATCRNETEKNDVVSIGRPIANTKVYILDERFQLVPVGVPGELFIAGAGLARGYRGCPESTAENFLPNPFSESLGERIYRTGDKARYLPNGEIEFLGRLDHQVKIRGFRVELGEVESIIVQHPDVNEAAVVAVEVDSYDRRLIAYVVGAKVFVTGELRNYLSKRLPSYLMPSAIVNLDSMPRTASGKVDRQALTEIRWTPHKEDFLPPRTPIENTLAQLWRELLGEPRIGIRDNFFELGGHSLLAIRFVSRLHAALKVELPLRAVFENPTIESLAGVIAGPSQELASMLAEVEAMSDKAAFAETLPTMRRVKEFHSP